jgi:hypothetical protein
VRRNADSWRAYREFAAKQPVAGASGLFLPLSAKPRWEPLVNLPIERRANYWRACWPRPKTSCICHRCCERGAEAKVEF